MSELAVLFEDDAHESMLRQLLRRVYGLTPPRVRYRRCVDCNGVEKAVREEVQYLRSKNFQKDRALLVVIDADRFGVEGRKRRFDQLLEAAGLSGRQDGERIAYVVPRLEAENWYVHFCCPERRPVSEEQDFKGDTDWRRLEANLGAAARELARAWPRATKEELPSIRDARLELKRVM
ncbi:hypothetical protein OV079_46350 [Nannocystis pusilla]|uniref:DUF4276 family protein n=1 Tax=Nannocystis pusilla TaxID=889268 RepID=A0A9X3J3H8_9BACT|nr:hypothetical protein [Nannocystis pusilla]MCY1012839.1 hypothetical protein [Nannocystis pusilla]